METVAALRGRSGHRGTSSVSLSRAKGELAAAAGRAQVAVEADLCDEIAAEMAKRGSLAPELVGCVYERRVAECRSRRRAGGVYDTPPH